MPNSGAPLEIVPVGASDPASWKVSDFDLREVLGVGSVGRVRLARHKRTGEMCAIKVMRKRDVIKAKRVDRVVAEKNINQELQHPFVVAIYRTMQDDQRLYVMQEYAMGGELFTHLRTAGRFPNDCAKYYAAEIILAIEHMHARDIIYRDLKPENLLLDKDGHLKLTNFGFAKKIEDQRTYTLCGTPEYMAPEVIQSKGHGKAVDWWALGILLYEMLMGYPPFVDESPLRTYEKILDGRINFPAWVDAKARDLIKGLLAMDHTKRLGTLKNGVADIKQLPYFSAANWDKVLACKYPAPIRTLALDGAVRRDAYPESPDDTKAEPLNPSEQSQFEGF